MKVGILFPLSGKHPNIGLDFMAGLQKFFQLNGVAEKVEFVKEGIGFGGVEKEVYAKAEKLLISDDVDVLVAYVDEKVLPVLYPLMQATAKLMIAVNPGANYPQNWIPQPTVLHLNLKHAFLSWMAGANAAATGNGQGAMATTFYDCGYMHSGVMVNHFLEKGGSIEHNYINNQLYDQTFEISQLTDFLSANPACKNLLCIFDELPASLFYNCLQQFVNRDQLSLFVSPMMMQAKALGEMETPYDFNIEGYLPWLQNSYTPENTAFTDAVKKQKSIFSLLGWETAIILNEVLQMDETLMQDGNAQVENVRIAKLNGPRGVMNLDEETNHFLSPVYHFSLPANTIETAITMLPDMEEKWREFTNVPTAGVISGWTNTYLCY